MRRQVLVSIFAVGASLAAWSGTASAHGYGYGYGYSGCCGDYGYYRHYRRHGTAPQTNDRYNNDHRDSEYAPPPPVYRYGVCCEYGYVRRRYYHHSDYHSDHYRHRRHYHSDYGYRRWHRDDYDD